MRFLALDPPAVLPALLEELKDNRRIVDTADDADMARLLSAAVTTVEQMASRPLVSRRYRGFLDGFAGPIKIDKPRVLALNAIGYDDADGNAQSVLPGHVDLGTEYVPAKVCAPPEGWPVTSGQSGCVRVDFTSGYGPSWNDVPENARHAVIMLAGHWYDTGRDPVVVGTSSSIGLTMEVLIDSFRAHTL